MTALVGNYIRFSDPGRRLGIEMEVEHYRTHTPDPNGLWNVKADNSLRNNGCEFYTTPILAEQVDAAAEYFYQQYKRNKYESNGRTGMHVHVDCRDFNIDELMALATAYALIEPAFFAQVPDFREENIYCVPWYRADSDVTVLTNAYRDCNRRMLSFLEMSCATCKYGALYFEPLHRFGTVEFRHAPTWTTKADFKKWVMFCYNFVEWVKNHGSTQAVMDRYEQVGPQALAREALGSAVSLPSTYEADVERLDVEILAKSLHTAVVPNDARAEWKRLNVKVSDKVKSHEAQPRRGSAEDILAREARRLAERIAEQAPQVRLRRPRTARAVRGRATYRTMIR